MFGLASSFSWRFGTQFVQPAWQEVAFGSLHADYTPALMNLSSQLAETR